MNATSSTSPIPAGDINASCRLPLLVLFGGAVKYLIVASVLGLIASIKFHSPYFLSDCAWFTYGRVHAAANIALLYGFAVPAGLGVVLWSFARVGGSRVVQPGMITIGGKLWHLGVFVGVIGILAGDSTGFENLEMPRYAAVILFVSYLVIGLGSAVTLHRRSERTLPPTHWFLLTALFWFPWIFSTAHLLLTICPVRGVTQPIVQWWFSANLKMVWLGLVGVAVLLDFIPRLTRRPLHSGQLALLTFWTIVLFATWGGIPGSAPVPAWMPAWSTVATVFTVSTVLTLMMNVYRTVLPGAQSENPVVGKFILFGVSAFAVSWLMNAISVFPPIDTVTRFTWFTVAQSHLNVYGFFAMTMFGAIYYIVPQVTGIEWPKPSFVRAHFWLAGAGVLLLALPLAIGGVAQGIKLNNPAIDFVTIGGTMKLPLRISTLGDLCLLIGHLLLVANIAGLSVRFARKHFLPAFKEATTELKPAEVKP